MERYYMFSFNMTEALLTSKNGYLKLRLIEIIGKSSILCDLNNLISSSIGMTWYKIMNEFIPVYVYEKCNT